MKHSLTRVLIAITLLALAFSALGVTPALANTTRTIVDGAGDVGRASSLVFNSSGNPVISYQDYANNDLELAVCNNPTCTAPTLRTLDSAGMVGEFTSLALNSSGNPIISYYDELFRDLKLAVCNNATCTGPTLITVDDTSIAGQYASLALNSSNNAVISYYDSRTKDLKLAVCNDAFCTNPMLITVDEIGDVGVATSLVLNASGNAVISYYDSTNSALKLAVCNNATCSVPTLTTVDDTGDVGWGNSLILNSSGNPIISYYDLTNDNLKLAACNDATCSAPTLTTVDNTAGVGRDNSLMLNGIGYPVISYYDQSNGALKLATCNDESCTDPTFTMVDHSATVGIDTSLLLNGSGNAVISYYDFSNGDLKLAVVDPTPPSVVSSVRLDANPTTAAQVRFAITFSESVSGVGSSDFNLTVTGGMNDSFVTAVTGSGTSYTITVTTGSGSGTIRLDVVDDDSILDTDGNPLDGEFIGGETYTVNKSPGSPTFYSIPTHDGQLIEASEDRNQGGAGGGSGDVSKTTFSMGDDAERRQYLGVLSFATGAGLPDNAVITKVTLKFKQQAIIGGGHPVTTFQGFMVDLKKGFFGADASLKINDFEAAASKSYGPFNTSLVGGWYSIDLTAGKGYINKLATSGGLTQIRLRFKLDDNNNAIANRLSLYSGNAAAADRPQLVIAYSIP